MTETVGLGIQPGGARRVAVNGQLNPLGTGGVETNLRSMLCALAGMERQFSISLLTLDRYASLFGVIAPFAEVRSWPYGEKAMVPLRAPAARGRALRRSLGRHAHIFDRLLYRYRLLRYGRPNSHAVEIDAMLSRWDVHAVHFPTPYMFDTTLPYIYEPWDLQHLHYPQFFSEDEHEFRERTYRAGCQGAALVLTATRWVKEDIAKRYAIPRSRIVAIPRSSLAVRRKLDEESIHTELRKAGVPHDFVLYPAMCFEHKNHIRLFQALARLRDRDGMRVNLVLSGRRHEPFWPKLTSAIADLRLGSQVTVLGAVSDELLTALYSRARFLIFPSLFEGLGLPVLEAFHHGLPVLAARATSLPEVVGDAGLLFEPTDVEAIAETIRSAYQNPSLLSGLAEKGRRRLEEFSWDRGRILLSACYKHVLGLDLSEEERAMFVRATSQ